MGFFKDFKDDFSQAVNELLPGEDNLETGNAEEDLMVNTLEDEVDMESELSKLDGLLEPVNRQQPAAVEIPAAQPKMAPEAVSTENPNAAIKQASASQAPDLGARAQTEPKEEPVASVPTQNMTSTKQEEKKMDTPVSTPVTTTTAAPEAAAPQAAPVAPAQSVPEKIISDEISVITEGTVIRGDVISNGSLDVRGQVEGNVSCNGKLTVTGVVNGNSNTSEFFADAAQVEGEVVSSGTVKIGLGSVIIGNVTSTSAVIAGAIKGDIDVQGPVVVDTSAVVMGNIKSRSVQINNGAVIEGFCSQCYSDVDVQSLFDKKGN